MELRIRSRTDDDGTYWWIEKKGLFFWWQYEPGIWFTLRQVERRLQEILTEDDK